MEVVVVVGAGLDVHKKRIVACCIDGRSSPPTVLTCTFGTFRDELERMRGWLLERECTHVAMESTGVYWIPVYGVLEGSFEIILGNPDTWRMCRVARPMSRMHSGSPSFYVTG